MTDNDTIHLDHKRKIQSAGLLKGNAVLLILSENFLGKSFILSKSESIIGRDKDCDFHIDDPLISKRHCKIVLNSDGHYHVEDLESTNSTYLNGTLLKKPISINYGDRIIIGDTIIRFFHEERFEAK
jgi:pSer/pThr/pTyr-binding forkhead associated (FHA) protein